MNFRDKQNDSVAINYVCGLLCSIAGIFLHSGETLLALDLTAPDELAVALFSALLGERVVAATATQLVARALEDVVTAVLPCVPTASRDPTVSTLASGVPSTANSSVVLLRWLCSKRRLLQLLVLCTTCRL